MAHDEHSHRTRKAEPWTGMGLGVVVGVTIGILMDNLPIGIAIGIAVGSVMGAGSSSIRCHWPRRSRR